MLQVLTTQELVRYSPLIMFKHVKIFIFTILFVILSSLAFGCYPKSEIQNPDDSIGIDLNQSQPSSNSETRTGRKVLGGCQDNQLSIEFFQTDNNGNPQEAGANYVIIFNPRSRELDFKVNMALNHELYAKDAQGKLRREYVPKQFHEIIADQNAQLNGSLPIAAINGDYIDPENKPQGLNISRGVEYSGAFKDKRSSFGISGGRPENRKATIQKGKRDEPILNYNLVGGNGRFYRHGEFKDICRDLGTYACQEETSRSMAAITDQGYVILLVNNSADEQKLYPHMFDDVLEGIAQNHCLGKIQEGMLFDGGYSTALYFDQKIYVENINPMGSVFLIYKTNTVALNDS